MNPEAVHVRLVGDAERGERENDLLPTRRQRRQIGGGLRAAVEQRLDLQQLSARRAAVNPESQIAVTARREWCVMQIQLVANGA